MDQMPNFPDTLVGRLSSGLYQKSEIILYDGEAIVEPEGVCERSKARIFVNWAPMPRILVQFNSNTISPETIYSTISISDSRDPLSLINISVDFLGNFTSELRSPTFHGNEDIISKIIFYIPNFTAYIGDYIKEEKQIRSGRVSIKDDKWEIIIDQRQDYDATRKENSSGYFISHMGSIKKIDGGLISRDEVSEVKHIVRLVLSFIAGRLVSPSMLEAYSEGNEYIGQEWFFPLSDPMLEVPNWYDTFIDSKDMISEVFPCISRVYADPSWKETIKEAIFWYLQTNHPNRIGLTSALVLQQACLELISWVKTVVVDQEISEADFSNPHNYPAAKRIRHLLSKLSVPASLPQLPNSASYINNIRTHNRTVIHDIPDLITYIRNGIVHPNYRDRRISPLDTPTEIDVWQIGQLCIELCILSLCEYRGKYSNRITATRVGQAECVPWVANTTP